MLHMDYDLLFDITAGDALMHKSASENIVNEPT